MSKRARWYSLEDAGPDGAGAQVWVAYPNPRSPTGWTLRIQFTPIRRELGPAPRFWRPIRPPRHPLNPFKPHGWALNALSTEQRSYNSRKGWKTRRDRKAHRWTSETAKLARSRVGKASYDENGDVEK